MPPHLNTKRPTKQFLFSSLLNLYEYQIYIVNIKVKISYIISILLWKYTLFNNKVSQGWNRVVNDSNNTACKQSVWGQEKIKASGGIGKAFVFRLPVCAETRAGDTFNMSELI